MRPAFTLKSRFILFLSLLAACAALVLGAVLHLLRTTDALQRTESARYQATQLATQYQARLDALTRNTMAFVASEQPEFEQQYLLDLAILTGRSPDAQGVQADALARFRRADFDAQELSLIEDAHALLLELTQIQRQAMGTAKGELDDGQGGVRIALPNALLAKALILSQQYTDTETAIQATIKAFDTRQAQRMAHRVEVAASDGRSAGYTAIAAVLALLLSSAAALFSLYRSIKRPLDQGLTLAGQLSAGNLTVGIQRAGRDEMGRMMAALESIRTGLNETLCEVADHFARVDTSAGVLASSQDTVLQNSHEQRQMAGQVSAAMHYLDSTVRQNHDRALEAMGAQGTIHAEDTAQAVAEQDSGMHRLRRTLARFQLDASLPAGAGIAIEYAD